MTIRRLFFIFITLIITSMTGCVSMYAQSGCKPTQSDEDEFIEVTYEVPFSASYGFKKMKGVLNSYPVTAVYTGTSGGVSISSFNAGYLLGSGIIKSTDIKVGGKAYEGGDVPVGATVTLRSISFGNFRRSKVRATVVGNDKQAFSVGKGFFGGSITAGQNTLLVTVKEKVKK